MTLTLALAVIAALLLGGVALGLLSRRTATRVRAARSTDPAVDLAALGLPDSAQRTGTVVQFSTAFCARCPGTRRIIEDLTTERQLTALHVDVTERQDLAEAFRLTQTPTVLILDAAGQLRTRLSGTLSRGTLAREIDAAMGVTA